MTRTREWSKAHTSLRGDVDALRIRLERVRLDLQRVAADLDALLHMPPYAVTATHVPDLPGD